MQSCSKELYWLDIKIRKKFCDYNHKENTQFKNIIRGFQQSHLMAVNWPGPKIEKVLNAIFKQIF